MLSQILFEKAIQTKAKRQQFDILLTVSSPVERFVLAGIGLLVLIFVMWLTLGNVSRTLSVDGKLIQSGGYHTITAAEAGVLREFLVEPGSEVDAGKRIAVQSVPEIERSLSAFSRSVFELDSSGDFTLSAQEYLDASASYRRHLEVQHTVRKNIVSRRYGTLLSFAVELNEEFEAGDDIAYMQYKDQKPPYAIVSLDTLVIPRVEAGMPAWVEISDGNGNTSVVAAGILSMDTDINLPSWVAELHDISPDAEYWISIELLETLDFPIEDGMSCKVHINIDKQSIFGLLSRSRQ